MINLSVAISTTVDVDLAQSAVGDEPVSQQDAVDSISSSRHKGLLISSITVYNLSHRFHVFVVKIVEVLG